MAGGITPADTPGFPITISVPGSYVLTSNLTVPRGLDGIVIAADDVLLDLNGFTIQGGALSFLDSGKGIHAPISGGEYKRLAIRNGTITGFSDGIYLFASLSRVEDMHVNTALPGSSGSAISLFSYVSGGSQLGSGIVRNNVALGLLSVTCPTVVTGNLYLDLNLNLVGSTNTCFVFGNVDQ